jgi:DUF1365 family protein
LGARAPAQPVRSALHRGTVVHARRAPVRHRFRDRVFTLLIDLDELPAFRRPAGGSSHSVFPRLLGYVFNPPSLGLWRDRGDRLQAVIYEVHDTFGGRHAHALRVAAGQDEGALARRRGKEPYVSPFIPGEAHYGFRMPAPGETFSLLIRERGAAGEILRAAIGGRRRALTGRKLPKAFAAHPLVTLRVIAAIHWHALRLLGKDARFHRDPAKRRRRTNEAKRTNAVRAP